MFSTIADFYSLITAHYGINNLDVLHIYTILEGSFFLLFYRSLFKDALVKKLMLVVIAAYILFAVYHSFFLANMFEFNSVTRVAECIILTTCGMYFFYTLFADDEYINLKRYPYFYINSGVLLYFMGNIFLFMLYAFVIQTEKNGSISVWGLHSVLNIGANILYCVGFLCNLPHRK
jgi:hypothetical protein